MAYVRLQLTPPFPYTNQYAFSWTTHPPSSKRTHFMNDPQGSNLGALLFNIFLANTVILCVTDTIFHTSLGNMMRKL